MATTALFVEILVVGMEALVWVTLIILALGGGSSVKWVLNALDQQSAMMTPMVLGLAYVLGVLMDRAADSLLHKIDKKVHGAIKHPASVSVMRFTVQMESPATAAFLDYVRSRLRISRTTSLNLILIILAATGFSLSPSCKFNRHSILIPTFSLGLPFLALSIFAWVRIAQTYNERLQEAYNLTLERRPAKPASAQA